MSIVAGDLRFFQSEMEGSSGGAMSLIEIPQGKIELLFKDTPRQFLVDGGIVYKKIFVINTNPQFALLNAVAYPLLQPTSGEELALALGDASDTDPLPLQFVVYKDYNNALQLGDMGTNQPRAIWMRRLTPASLADFDEDIPAFFQLAVRGFTS